MDPDPAIFIIDLQEAKKKLTKGSGSRSPQNVNPVDPDPDLQHWFSVSCAVGYAYCTLLYICWQRSLSKLPNRISARWRIFYE
jgi:hypothetical protein